MGSVSHAAIEISLSQSATGLALRELDKSLDASLFERIAKKLMPNSNGHRFPRVFIPKAVSILSAGLLMLMGSLVAARKLMDWEVTGICFGIAIPVASWRWRQRRQAERRLGNMRDCVLW